MIKQSMNNINQIFHCVANMMKMLIRSAANYEFHTFKEDGAPSGQGGASGH